jgi:hypothetical protein
MIDIWGSSCRRAPQAFFLAAVVALSRLRPQKGLTLRANSCGVEEQSL